MNLDLSTASACIILAIILVVSARAYRHADRRYEDGKSERIASPCHFSWVYRWIQASTLIGGFSAYLTSWPILLEVHESRALLWAGQLVMLLGLWLFVFSKRTLGAEYSPCFDSWVSQRIVRSGPYAKIRHPIYTANLMILGGLFLATGSVWLGLNALVLFAYYLVAARREESALGKRYPEYAAYRREAGQFLPRAFHSLVSSD
ncbi:MAG: isoprenylcysteine carboxylmethyltransferase family protein [Planctomycetota bacterium]